MKNLVPVLIRSVAELEIKHKFPQLSVSDLFIWPHGLISDDTESHTKSFEMSSLIPLHLSPAHLFLPENLSASGWVRLYHCPSNNTFFSL